MKRYFLVPHDIPTQSLEAGSVLVWDGLTSNPPAADSGIPDDGEPLLLLRPVYSTWKKVHHIYRANLIEFIPAREPEPDNFPYGHKPASLKAPKDR